MGIKIKKLIFEIPTEKSTFAIQTLFFFVQKGFCFGLDWEKNSCILLHSESVKWGFFGWKLPDLGHFQGFSSFWWVKILLKSPNSGSFQPKRHHLTDSKCRRMHEIFFSAQNEPKVFLNEKEQCLNSKCTFFSCNFKNQFFNFDAHFGFLQNSLKYS